MTREKYGVHQDLSEEERKRLKKLARKDRDELTEDEKAFLRKKEASGVEQKGNVLATEEEGTKPFEG